MRRFGGGFEPDPCLFSRIKEDHLDTSLSFADDEANPALPEVLAIEDPPEERVARWSA
jgi:hypothetical protein